MYDLFDAQGKEMGIDGTCVIYVIPDGCSKPRTLKCLATPSLDEEELLLGWVDMVNWGILRRDFHILSDEDMEVNKLTSVEKSSHAIPDADVCPPKPMSVIGEVAADSQSSSGHLPDGTNGHGVDSEVDKELEALRSALMTEFEDVFTVGHLPQSLYTMKRRPGGW